MTTTNQLKQLALNELGFENIAEFTSITDKAVVKLNAQFENTMVNSLQRYRWAFALGYSTLTSPATVAGQRYSYRYTLPVDFLFLRNQYASATSHVPLDDYILLPGYIYTNQATSISIEYTKRIADASLPVYFVEFVKVRLALDLCFDLTGDTDLLQLLQQKEALAYINATNIDSRQNKPKRIRSSPFVDIRG